MAAREGASAAPFAIKPGEDGNGHHDHDTKQALPEPRAHPTHAGTMRGAEQPVSDPAFVSSSETKTGLVDLQASSSVAEAPTQPDPPSSIDAGMLQQQRRASISAAVQSSDNESPAADTASGQSGLRPAEQFADAAEPANKAVEDTPAATDVPSAVQQQIGDASGAAGADFGATLKKSLSVKFKIRPGPTSSMDPLGKTGKPQKKNAFPSGAAAEPTAQADGTARVNREDLESLKDPAGPSPRAAASDFQQEDGAVPRAVPPEERRSKDPGPWAKMSTALHHILVPVDMFDPACGPPITEVMLTQQFKSYGKHGRLKFDGGEWPHEQVWALLHRLHTYTRWDSLTEEQYLALWNAVGGQDSDTYNGYLKKHMSLKGMHVSHIIAESNGGANHPLNYIVLGKDFNEHASNGNDHIMCYVAGLERTKAAIMVSMLLGNMKNGRTPVTEGLKVRKRWKQFQCDGDVERTAKAMFDRGQRVMCRVL